MYLLSDRPDDDPSDARPEPEPAAEDRPGLNTVKVATSARRARGLFRHGAYRSRAHRIVPSPTSHPGDGPEAVGMTTKAPQPADGRPDPAGSGSFLGRKPSPAPDQFDDPSGAPATDLAALTETIVAAFVSSHRVDPKELRDLRASVLAALNSLHPAPEALGGRRDLRSPAHYIETQDHIVGLDDGRRYLFSSTIPVAPAQRRT
jgi:hypothetical protein